MPLIKSFRAFADIAARKIVATSATDKQVVTAAANTDLVLGVSDELATTAGDMADVVLSGLAPVTAGGDVNFGEPVMADANGDAIPAVPAAGSVVRYAGFALSDAAAGDIFNIIVAPGIINAPV